MANALGLLSAGRDKSPAAKITGLKLLQTLGSPLRGVVLLSEAGKNRQCNLQNYDNNPKDKSYDSTNFTSVGGTPANRVHGAGIHLLQVG
jgi:hypothetical protein